MSEAVVLQGGSVGSLWVGDPLLQIVILVVEVLDSILLIYDYDRHVLSSDLKDLPHVKVDPLLAALDQHGAVILQCLCCCYLGELCTALESSE